MAEVNVAIVKVSVKYIVLFYILHQYWLAKTVYDNALW